jgi:hypothetical protein
LGHLSTILNFVSASSRFCLLIVFFVYFIHLVPCMECPMVQVLNMFCFESYTKVTIVLSQLGWLHLLWAAHMKEKARLLLLWTRRRFIYRWTFSLSWYAFGSSSFHLTILHLIAYISTNTSWLLVLKSSSSAYLLVLFVS